MAASAPFHPSHRGRHSMAQPGSSQGRAPDAQMRGAIARSKSGGPWTRCRLDQTARFRDRQERTFNSRQVADLGNVPVAITAAEFGKTVAEETEKWRNL